MPRLTNKEKVQAVAASLLREAQQKSGVSAAKSTSKGYNSRGKILYYADNGAYVLGDENECMVFRPNMPCYWGTKSVPEKFYRSWGD